MSSNKDILPKLAPTSQAKNEKAIISAIKHPKNLDGSSFVEIKTYLTLKQPKTDVSDPKNLNLHLKTAVDHEKLTLTDGKYQVHETKRRRSRSAAKSSGRRRSRSRKRTGGRKRSGSRKRTGGKRRSRSRKRSGGRKRSGRRTKSRTGSRRRRRSKKVHHAGDEDGC